MGSSLVVTGEDAFVWLGGGSLGLRSEGARGRGELKRGEQEGAPPLPPPPPHSERARGVRRAERDRQGARERERTTVIYTVLECCVYVLYVCTRACESEGDNATGTKR